MSLKQSFCYSAPATLTLSVTSNPKIAAAFRGMTYFKPHTIFNQQTTGTLMAALLISDITSRNSVVSELRTNLSIYLSILQ